MRCRALLPAALAGCVAAAPSVQAPALWLNDPALCDMPAEVRALGNPAVLGPRGVTSVPVTCEWSPAIEPMRIGTVERQGRCDDGSGWQAARFLIAVTEAGVRVDSDHAALRRMSFSACAAPGPEEEAPAAAPPAPDSAQPENPA